MPCVAWVSIGGADWGAMHDVVPSFTNGMDMSMPGGFNAQTLALLYVALQQ